ncbi:MAG: hypothetical protein GEU83_09935 [Pseudonocardiaceae bacterium]|nr:hypothetical protein [Pseudonocardiaceae bacterium]
MTNVYQVRWRVLRQQLEGTLARAQQCHDDDLARLATLGLALLERHAVNATGRCRYCRAQRRWWRRRPRRCLVLPMMSWYLEQPSTVVSNRHG